MIYLAMSVGIGVIFRAIGAVNDISNRSVSLMASGDATAVSLTAIDTGCSSAAEEENFGFLMQIDLFPLKLVLYPQNTQGHNYQY